MLAATNLGARFTIPYTVFVPLANTCAHTLETRCCVGPHVVSLLGGPFLASLGLLGAARVFAKTGCGTVSDAAK